MSILQEVAIGRTTPQIAQNPGLSPETVKWYRKRLLVKFSATTSAAGGAQSDYEQYTIKL